MDVFKDSLNGGCYHVRTKSQAFVIDFDNDTKEQLFLEIVSLLKKHKDKNVLSSSLKTKLQKKYDLPLIVDVLKQLADNHIFQSFTYNEKAQELSFLFPTNTNDYVSHYNQIQDKTIALIESSDVSNFIKKQLETLPFQKVISKKINDLGDESLWEVFLKKNTVDFIIVDGNAWSPYHLELINKVALKKNIPWLYVGGYEFDQIKIGPLFYGKETGCYDCLRARIYGNYDYPDFLKGYETYLHQNRKPSASDFVVYGDLYHQLLATHVTLEVVHFFEKLLLLNTWKSMMIYDIHTNNIEKHPLLKKPYCTTCKPELSYSITPWLEPLYINDGK